MSSWMPIELNSKKENEGGLSGKFIYKFSFDDQNFVFLISDLKTIWKQELKSEEILKKCKELNRRLNAPLAAILTQINESLASDTCTKFLDEKFSLTLKSMYKSVPFNWMFDLKSSDSSELLNEFICPLYTTISNLLAEKDELLEVIKRKDEEINDYKENGAKVSRVYLETDQFVPDSFSSEWKRSYNYASSITKSTFVLACDVKINKEMSKIVEDCFDKNIIEMSKNKTNHSPQKIAAKLSPQKPKKLRNRMKRTHPTGAYFESDSSTDEEVKSKKVNITPINSKILKSTTTKSSTKNSKARKKGIF